MKHFILFLIVLYTITGCKRDSKTDNKNIGVRIEDDVLITSSGCIVLSKNIPKEIDEIERIMSWRNK